MLTAVVTLLAMSVALAMPGGVCVNDLIGHDCCQAAAAACTQGHSCCRPTAAPLPSSCCQHEHTSAQRDCTPMAPDACGCLSVQAPHFVTSIQQDKASMDQVAVPVVVALLPMAPHELAGTVPGPVSPDSSGTCMAPLPPSRVSCVLRI